jgi:hypothetical protein
MVAWCHGNQVLFTPLPNPAPCFLLDFYWSVTSSRPSWILNCSRDREFFKITLVGWLLPAIKQTEKYEEIITEVYVGNLELITLK